MNKWHSCKNRLPPPFKMVLLTDCKEIFIGHTLPDLEHWLICGELKEKIFKVKYWQYLPELPNLKVNTDEN